jgi:hypothetical protein
MAEHLEYDDVVQVLDSWLGTQTELYVVPSNEPPTELDETDAYLDVTGWVVYGTWARVFGLLRREQQYMDEVYRRDGEPIELTERRAVAYSFDQITDEFAEYAMFQIERAALEDAYWIDGWLWIKSGGVALAISGGLNRLQPNEPCVSKGE